jgi:uncharacterized protein YdaU (DUF1376 family)
MFSPKWVKWDPRAWLVGTSGLSLEERGAYDTILNLLYCRGGALPDDDRANAHQLGVDLRVWRRLKARLVGLRKLSTAAGSITNERVSAELTSAELRYLSSSQAGTISAVRKGYRNIRFNGLPSTTVARPVATNHNHIDRKRLSDE